ncbi:tetrahydromethanopterin S-methyltransferase, subunit A [Cenarchaeum symbiosum A]|uniref:Tetrahydromethanopterin S-methyltransferase, subunit A n=1 Tax=Cenarchaeum symbiosum (strain A) TaxID=414004 RepID=A0RXI7_CENSY|nr:tetrahydromethanopterin S-methyltransferase, subunit A [Cenarchaeum symbiosum A]
MRGTVHLGNPESTVAVCTLSSMDLLDRIAGSELMEEIALAGRLLSENEGIDALIRSANSGNIRTVVLCGREVRGHLAGHSLLELHKNGIGPGGRIAGSASPHPVLESGQAEVDLFRGRVDIIDAIGETGLDDIGRLVRSAQ